MTLPPLEKGEKKVVEREVLGEEDEEEKARVRLEVKVREETAGDANMRVWSEPLDAVAVATSIDSVLQRKQKRLK